MRTHSVAAPIPSPLSRWAPWVIVVLGLAAYLNSFTPPFLFDDLRAVTHNETIRSLGSAWVPPGGGAPTANRPFTNFTLGLNFMVSGLQPWSYHVTNLAIHLAAALALFGLVRRTLALPSVAHPAADPVAFIAAALWVTHPLQTESVTAIAQRTESLCGLLFLTTLFAFLRAVTARRAALWWTASFAACLAGMATKEVMVVAPPLLLLFDRTFLAGSWREAWRRRGVVHGAYFATTALTLALVFGGGGSRGTAAGFGLGVEWWQYTLKQAEAIVLYLRLALVPAPLVADYGTAVAHSVTEVWWQLLLVLALLGATLWALRRRPAVGFLGAWFFVILAPSSSVVPLVEQTIAEHRMYLPLAAASAGLALLIARWWPARLIGIGLALAVLWAGLSYRRNLDYRDELTLWRDTVAKVPRNPRAHYNLGSTLLESDRPAEALVALEQAARLAPGDAGIQVNLGNTLRRLGRGAEAVAALRRAAALQPTLPAAQLNLGLALVATGDLNAAEAAFAQAWQLDPGLADAAANLASLHLAQADPAKAATRARAALALDGRHVLARRTLGYALLGQGDLRGGEVELRHAVEIDAGDVVAWRGLAFANLRLGRIDDALRQADTALALEPGNRETQALRAEIRRARR